MTSARLSQQPRERTIAPKDRKAEVQRAILHGAVRPVILRLSLPTIAVLIAQTVVGVAETYYVSRMGTDALIGVSVFFPVWVLMTMMSASGIGGGIASAAGRGGAVGRARRTH